MARVVKAKSPRSKKASAKSGGAMLPDRVQGDDADDFDAAAKQREENDVARWQERIGLANKIWNAWEKRFQCRQGWEWYEGYQGRDAHATGDPSLDPYVVNLMYPTVEVKIPSLYFSNPKATILPKAPREDDTLTFIHERARLREDTVNSVALDPDMHLKDHTTLALKESFFFYGVIEVGYSADWAENPNAGKPALEGDVTTIGYAGGDDVDEDGEALGDPRLAQPDMIPVAENIYFKRIPAEDFRMSPRANHILEQCDWVGYREWMYVSDLKKNPHISDDAKLQLKEQSGFTQGVLPDVEHDDQHETDHLEKEMNPTHEGMVRVWKLWDMRQKMRLMIPDNGRFYLMPPTPYKVFPFSLLCYHPRLRGGLPMPPHFNWMSPQAELNESREMERIHRRRMVRRYQMQKGAMDAEEVDKLESGGDGTIVLTNTQIPAIAPIEDAPLDFAVTKNINQSQQDFANITNTGGDQRAVAESETATQASVIENRARIRESFGQQQIASWISDIFRRALMTIEEHMTLPFWIQRNVDPMGPQAMIEVGRVAEVYQQITAEELGPLNYDVVVAAESLSPINEDIERQRFGEFMTILSGNPVMMLMLRTADGLLRKFLNLYGIRNEKVIQEVKLAIEVALLAQTGGASGQLPTDSGESGKRAEAAGAGGPAMGGGPPAGDSGPGNKANLPGLVDSANQTRAQLGMPS